MHKDTDFAAQTVISLMFRLFFAIWVSVAAFSLPVAAADPPPAAEGRSGSVTGLALPRFVALGSNEVNVRTGPGSQYPIAYVYMRRGLPVEITAEFEFYRKIRDQDGAEGWVHKNLLSGRRTANVIGTVRALYRDPDVGSPSLLLAEPGVQGRLRKCKDNWCEIEIAGRKGFMQQSYLYGVYPGESFE